MSGPEDGSDGNETLSAPSEFLAEFLSAIMRRQYAEALKYCRLILQYEPHNATARGFYPLLQHKLQNTRAGGGEWRCGSSSEEPSAAADSERLAPVHPMSQGADADEASAGGSRSPSRASVGSQSSLELDSSEALAHSSPSFSCSHHSESAASGGRWESSGSASRSEPDDNGNAPPPVPAARPGDVENDNAPSASAAPPRAPLLKGEESTASLQRLRAQFTCSIK